MNKLIFCTQRVNKSNIRRENRNGVEHIVITSFTLPPDIVMNGVLYPKEVTHRDYQTFNRTPATIEHPQINGSFVSASDPEADMDFRIGAFNENATLAGDGRLKLDKVINVKKAMMSDKGKRLLDRIAEIESSKDGRPMHTSVGVWTEETILKDSATEFNGIKTNAAYSSIVTRMTGDHDAFLLDSTGAATPSQGTGIGINAEKIKVEEFFITNGADPVASKDLRVNKEISFEQIRDGIYVALQIKLQDIKEIHPWIVEIYDDYFIYELDHILYRASYEVDDNGNVSVQDDKQEVVLKKEYVTKAESTINPTIEDKGNDMISKTDLISMLTSAKITVNADATEDELKLQLNELLCKSTKADPALAVNKELTDTVTSLTEKIAAVTAQLEANNTKAVAGKVASIKACAKYAAIPESALTLMANSSVEDFDKMYTDSIPSQGIGSTHLNNNAQDFDESMFAVNAEDK